FCGSAEQQFTREKAEFELRRYRRKGARVTTRLLRDGLSRAGLVDGTLLDVGAGIGALTLELLSRGVKDATAVDASSAYVACAREEAERRAVCDRVQYIHADFMQAAADLPGATIVTLDRVVCCYPSYEPLLEEALRHAGRAFAFSYPRDRWYVRAVFGADNAIRARRSSFRTFVHSERLMEQIIERAGFE